MVSPFFIFGLSFFVILINPLGWGLFYYSSPLHIPFVLVNSNKFFYRIQRPVFYFLLFVAYTFVSYFCISHYKGANVKVLRYVYELIIFWIFLKSYIPLQRAVLLNKFYIFSCLAIVIKMAIQRDGLHEENGIRYTIFNFLKYMDPNFLSALFVLPCVLLFSQIISKKATKCAYLVLISFLVAVFMTGSRGGLLAIILGCGLEFLRIKNPRIKILSIFLVFIGIIVGLKVAADKIDRFINLMDGSNMLRFHLWYTAFRIFLSNPLFGRGANSMIVLGPEFGVRINLIVHNTFLEILADYGICGFLLWIAPFIYILKRAVKRHNTLVVSVLAGTFFAAFFISAQDSSFWWQNIILCTIMLRYRQEDILNFKLFRGKYFARIR